MRKEYIIASEDGKLYRSFSRDIMPFYCFSSSDIHVYSAVTYSGVRKFRSLHWATHRARFLSKHSDTYYYVCTAERVGSLYKINIVDDTINDKLKESRKETYDIIEQMIADWRVRVGLDKK